MDDSKVVRSMVAYCLKDYPCTVIEATNGQECLTAVRRHTPDLILLDVKMPVMDGREALAELRRNPACKAIPVIMLTAEGSKEIVVEAARLGISGYILKPFRQDMLQAALRKLLAPEEEAATASVDGRTLLVVDHSDKVLAAVRAALGDTMKVLTAATGREAIELYTKFRPGVVLIDLALKEMDGFETLAELKRRGRSSYVAMAVRGDSQTYQGAREAGFHAVLQKPFREGDLIQKVIDAMSTVASSAELLESCLSVQGELAVLHLPDLRMKLIDRMLPAVGKRFRSLVEGGRTKLILDLSQLTELGTEEVRRLVQLLSAASSLGIATVVCTPNRSVIESLKLIAETRSARFAPDRDAARQCFR